MSWFLHAAHTHAQGATARLPADRPDPCLPVPPTRPAHSVSLFLSPSLCLSALLILTVGHIAPYRNPRLPSKATSFLSTTISSLLYAFFSHPPHRTSSLVSGVQDPLRLERASSPRFFSLCFALPLPVSLCTDASAVLLAHSSRTVAMRFTIAIVALVALVGMTAAAPVPEVQERAVCSRCVAAAAVKNP